MIALLQNQRLVHTSLGWIIPILSKMESSIKKNNSMSYLNNIRTFVRVYELGSMSAAGRDLR
ncbi:MAG: LysR family transcriptional regulator, partial [Ascidiaceihabitans sp.]|nr:LysR family transcriptional regulator [Ascidiaceihabitans sp.]